MGHIFSRSLRSLGYMIPFLIFKSSSLRDLALRFFPLLSRSGRFTSLRMPSSSPLAAFLPGLRYASAWHKLRSFPAGSIGLRHRSAFTKKRIAARASQVLLRRTLASNGLRLAFFVIASLFPQSQLLSPLRC